MYLINVHTFELEEFFEAQRPKYAILSHRWEDGEVSFRDIKNLEMASAKKGFSKIRASCEIAIQDGYRYVWIDTCCINKESSAELSEAINSMFQWYKSSAVCYTFLSDVTARKNGDTVEQEIKASAWFTRGWTLQELIAPLDVTFYNRRWEYLGTKETLCTLLTSCTGIDRAILSKEVPLYRRSIAQRMSWASKRTTTRVEDIAYCLLGIFDVAMPLLYGEREQAFLRLQEEILKKTHDHSLFAWPIHREHQPGLLADSPAAFAEFQHIVGRHSPSTSTVRRGYLGRKYVEKPYSMTNRGLSIQMMAIQIEPDTYMVRLKCVAKSSIQQRPEEQGLAMYMRKLYDDDQYARVKYKGETFARVSNDRWEQAEIKAGTPERSTMTTPVGIIEMNVPQTFDYGIAAFYKNASAAFSINPRGVLYSDRGRPRFTVSASGWLPEPRLMSVKPGAMGIIDVVDLSEAKEYGFIKLGYDFDGNPLCCIRHITDSLNEDLSGIHHQVQEKLKWEDVFNECPRHTERSSWNFKGDRIFGVYVHLDSSTHLRVQRKEFGESWSWDVCIRKV